MKVTAKCDGYVLSETLREGSYSASEVEGRLLRFSKGDVWVGDEYGWVRNGNQGGWFFASFDQSLFDITVTTLTDLVTVLTWRGVELPIATAYARVYWGGGDEGDDRLYNAQTNGDPYLATISDTEAAKWFDTVRDDFVATSEGIEYDGELIADCDGRPLP